MISPYAGGERVAAAAGVEAVPILASSTPELRIATLNPGKAGLACLGTDEVLYWRLWGIAAALQREGVRVCVLPRARLPPGARLPGVFPYVWIGRQTCAYASVGFFVQAEIARAVSTSEEHCGERWRTLQIRVRARRCTCVGFTRPRGAIGIHGRRS